MAAGGRLLLSAITPTLTVLGTSATKRLPAARAAARRVGRTSVACIEPLTSVTSTIDARSTGTATVFCGRAAAAVALVGAVENHEHRDRQQENQDEGSGEAHGEGCDEAHGVRAGRFC